MRHRTYTRAVSVFLGTGGKPIRLTLEFRISATSAAEADKLLAESLRRGLDNFPEVMRSAAVSMINRSLHSTDICAAGGGGGKMNICPDCGGPMRLQVDECSDAHGGATVRPFDGTPNGDTDAEPIATFYSHVGAERAVACWNACEGIEDPEALVGTFRAMLAHLEDVHTGQHVPPRQRVDLIHLARSIIRVPNGVKVKK